MPRKSILSPDAKTEYINQYNMLVYDFIPATLPTGTRQPPAMVLLDYRWNCIVTKQL